MEFFTVDELAALLRVTPSAIYVQRHRGEAPGALGVKLGRRILYRRGDLDRWFDERLAEQRADRPV